MKYPIIVILASLLIVSCKTAPVHYHVDEDLLSTLNFKKGSSWVYKDSLTGEVRTFYATHYIAWESRRQDYDVDYDDVIATTIEADTTHGFQYHDFMELDISGDKVGVKYFYYRYKGPGHDVEEDASNRLSNTMVVRAHTFEKVSRRLDLDSNNYAYVAKNIGIIKMDLTDVAGTRHVWELSSWNIVK